MNIIKKEDLDKIALFCERHLLPLELLKSKNNTAYYSSRRKSLIYLLHFASGWSSIKIAKVIPRNSSTFRLQFPQHEWDLKYNQAYRMRWEALVIEWDKMGITEQEEILPHNLKPIKLQNIKTGDIKHFPSKSKAALFLKCSQGLIQYYEGRGITEFLGYRIINN
jgi:hypothetical protein